MSFDQNFTDIETGIQLTTKESNSAEEPTIIPCDSGYGSNSTFADYDLLSLKRFSDIDDNHRYEAWEIFGPTDFLEVGNIKTGIAKVPHSVLTRL